MRKPTLWEIVRARLTYSLYWRPRAWLLRREVHIDPVSGNDANDGKSYETALRTCAEFGRRFNGKLAGDLWIYVSEDVPSSDPLVLSMTINRGVKIWMRGNKKKIEDHGETWSMPV